MKKAKWLRLPLKVSGYIVPAVAALITLFCLYLAFFVKDIAPIDDSFMDIAPAEEVADEENAYELLILATFPINEFPRDPLEETVKKEFEEDGKLSDATLEKARFFYRERFEMMDRAVKLPRSQGRWATAPADRIPNFISLRNLAKVRLEIARGDYEEGRAAEAAEIVKDIARAGEVSQARDGGATLIGLMVGVAIKEHILYRLNSMISDGWLPEDEDGWTDFLSGLKENPDTYADTIRAEYQIAENILIHDLTKYSSGDFKYISPGDLGPLGNDFIRFIAFRLAFRPERTRKMFHERYREFIDNSYMTCDKVDLTYPPSVGVFPTRFGELKMLVRGEYGTNVFAAVTIPNFYSIFGRKCYSDFIIDATRIRLAALKHEREKGAPPATLGELVPAYISEIPADPFDGKPIRYDAARGTIYSVGTDFADGGGEAKKTVFADSRISWKELRDEKDLVVNIK